MYLRELKQSVTQFKGIGTATASALKSIGILTVSDLIQHYPREYQDRINPAPLKNGIPYGYVNTVVEILAHEYIGWGRKKTLKILIRDETASAALLCFGRNFLAGKIIAGERYYLCGTFSYKYNEIQASIFEIEPFTGTPSNFGQIIPIYPLTGNLTQGILRRVQQKALKEFGIYIDNELPEIIKKENNFLNKADAISNIHHPESLENLEKAKRTLIYEELFYLQLVVGRRAFKRKEAVRERKEIKGKLQEKLVKALPFKLTMDQNKVLNEINNDLAGEKPMGRLLQGDVGSGKTLIAFLSCLEIIESGAQTAFMAPTELLARQHAENAARLLAPLGIRLGFLSGNIRQNNRKALLDHIRSGEIDLVIGTHALFSSDVIYKNLGLIIVDEQHRFGVLQRIALTEKGSSPDLLLMTATPIPRTLSLTAFGDLDVSTIKTMPPGRKAVETHLAREGNEEKVYNWVRKEIKSGRQAYFVYPLIQQSEKLFLKDAESMFRRLQEKVFPELKLGLIHSRINEEEKNTIMSRFNSGTIDILVATSVVEVGVDIPNATCMVIEHAERFGLSALHQLRGRVGRGPDQSYAFLIYSNELSDEGKKRLKVMKESTDGFYIAEEDLKIRGPGELSGMKQSGFLKLTIADLVNDIGVMQNARKKVFSILKTDPGLLNPEHEMLRKVLSTCPPFAETILNGG